MHSALIRTVRSYAACHMTTAHQRHPISVPLVLEDRSTQTTTHLVDIIQTVSRYLLKAYDFALYGLYLHPSLQEGDQRLSSVVLINRTLAPKVLSLYGVK